MNETPVFFKCVNEELMGICHHCSSTGHVGVLIIVGGPQYRVGSHRQFVLLARHFADCGIATFRFDYRGMGDSSGEQISFEYIDADICAAIDTFMKMVPQLKSIVLWGLCDAASAAMIYAHTDSRVKGLILLNPWARSEQGISKVYLKNYYLKRLIDKAFWRKIYQKEIRYNEVIFGFWMTLVKAFGGGMLLERSRYSGVDGFTFTDRMLLGIEKFSGNSLLILCGDDLTAQEFRNHVTSSSRWKAVLKKPQITERNLADANHTFSKTVWRNQVADWCVAWVQKL